MKQMKRVTALTLILMMVISSLSFATPSKDVPTVEETLLDLLSKRETKGEKMVGFDQVDLQSQEEVRVIVEFYGSPIIETATQKGLQVSDMDANTVASMTETITDEQMSILDQIEETIDETHVDVHQQFSNVFNGVSMTVSAKAAKDISELSNVKSVYIANEYARPEMVNTHLITNSKFVNEEYGYKGEGMVVAIIDTGLDAYHQDFNIDPGTSVKFTEASVNALIADNNLKGYYVNEKVPYGWNYMDNGNIIKDIGEGASMHGMHVGGTVAANGIIKGVAPNAQLLALKVFGNDPDYPSTYSDIIIAAIDDGIALGADVMNLSLGAAAQNVNQDDPEQQAITRAVDNGILMSVSAGNEAYWGNGSGVHGSLPFASNPDIGVTGSPGLTSQATTVASVNNYEELNAYTVNNENLDAPFLGYASGSFVDGDYDLVRIGGSKIGQAGDFEGLDLTGKIALVSRGNNFTDTAINAQAAGAVGVVLYNVPGREIVTRLVDTVLPFMMIPAEGVILEEMIGDLESVNITINKAPGVYDTSAGQLSSFSSWGSTPDMGFKPNVAAPGQYIYSTLENNTYGIMHGTSMAAPHVAGGAALIYQRLKETNDFAGLINKTQDLPKLVTAILSNSGRAVVDQNIDEGLNDDSNYDATVTYTSPRGQGAGSMDLKSAIDLDVLVYNTASGDNYEAFYNAKEVNDGFEFDLTAYNQGDSAKYYKLDAVVQTNMEKQGINFLESTLLDGTSYTFTVDHQVVDSIVIPAGESVNVNVKVALNNPTLHDTGKAFAEAFPNGNFIEGYVFFYELQAPDSSEVLALKAVYLEAVAKVGEMEVQITGNQALVAQIKADELAPLTALTLEAQNAFDAVNAIKLAIEAMEAAQVAVTQAQEALTAYIASNGSLEENQADLESLQGQLAAETALIEATAAHEAAQAAVVAAGEALAAEEAKVAPLELEIKTNSDFLATLSEDDPLYAGLVEKIAGLNETLKALKADIEARTLAIVDLEAVVVEKAAAEAQAQALVDSFVPVEDLQGQIATVEAMIAEINRLTGVLADAQAALLLVTVDPTEEELLSLETLEALATALAEAKTAEALIVGKIATFEQVIAGQMNELATLKAGVETAKAPYIKAASAERKRLPISVPFSSFKGNWSEAPAFDAPRGSGHEYYGFTSLLVDLTPTKTGYFMNQDHPAFSPNGDDTREQINIIYTVVRNLVDVSYEIQDKDMQTVFEIKERSHLRKNYFDGGAHGAQRYTYGGDTIWDGKINFETAPEGNYFYVVKGQLVDGTPKELRFPVQVDVTRPSFVDYEWSQTLKANFTDNLSGISEYILATRGNNPTNGLQILEQGNETGEFDLSKYGVKAGDYVFVAAFDYAGNLSIGDVNQVEADLPKIAIDSPSSHDSVTTREVTIKGSVKDASPVTVTLVFDKGQAGENEVVVDVKEDGTFEYDAVFAKDGKTGVYVKALDQYGSEFSFTRWFFIDSQAPVVEILKVTVDSEEGQEVAIEEGYVNMPQGSKRLFVTLRASDNYPELKIEINGSVKEVVGLRTDWYSTQANIKPVEHVGTYEVRTLGQTKVPVKVEVFDALSNMTNVGFEVNVDTSLPGNPGNVESPVNTDTPGNNAPITTTPVIPEEPARDSDRVFDEVEAPLGAVNFNKAYMNGYADGTFKPQAMITRAQLAKIYVNILNLDLAVDADQTFKDVSKDHWSFAYVETLKDAGIIKGYENGTFKPDQELRLSELAQTFTNYWSFLNVEVSDKTIEGLDLSNHWSSASIYRLFNAKVVEEGMMEIQPEAYVSRAKIVLMINKLLGRAPLKVETSSFEDVTDSAIIGAVEAATTTVLTTKE